jgi:hypothetical protein
MQGKDTWYFAYGSNLDAEQKEARTGKIREARRCRAPGYRFAFNKRGVDGSAKANIMPSSGSETWGVVYRCSSDALKEMDRWEGVRSGHYVRHALEVVTDDGQTLPASRVACWPSRSRPSTCCPRCIAVCIRWHSLIGKWRAEGADTAGGCDCSLKTVFSGNLQSPCGAAYSTLAYRCPSTSHDKGTPG